MTEVLSDQVRTRNPLNSLSKTKLKSSIMKGMTYSAIGKIFGVSRQAVFQRALSLGLSDLKSGITSKRNEKIIKMYNRKVSIEKISESVGLSVPQTYRIIKLWKLKNSK